MCAIARHPDRLWTKRIVALLLLGLDCIVFFKEYILIDTTLF